MRHAAALIVFLIGSAAALAQPQTGPAPPGGQAFQLPADPRTALEIPPYARDFLRYEMRGHLEQLNALMARIGEGDFKAASEFAASGLAVMGNHPPGAPNPAMFVSPEFRMLGQAMHKAAGEVARSLGAAASPPSADDWRAVAAATANLTAACAGCHGSFRLK